MRVAPDRFFLRDTSRGTDRFLCITDGYEHGIVDEDDRQSLGFESDSLGV